MSASVRKNEPPTEPRSKLKTRASEPPIFRVVRADTDLFATLDGLETQTGVDRDVLRRLVLKELTDNALDAADTAGRGGHATIRKLGDDEYEITDEGNGIPARLRTWPDCPGFTVRWCPPSSGGCRPVAP